MSSSLSPQFKYIIFLDIIFHIFTCRLFNFCWIIIIRFSHDSDNEGKCMLVVKTKTEGDKKPAIARNLNSLIFPDLLIHGIWGSQDIQS